MLSWPKTDRESLIQISSALLILEKPMLYSICHFATSISTFWALDKERPRETSQENQDTIPALKHPTASLEKQISKQAGLCEYSQRWGSGALPAPREARKYAAEK